MLKIELQNEFQNFSHFPKSVFKIQFNTHFLIQIDQRMN